MQESLKWQFVTVFRAFMSHPCPWDKRQACLSWDRGKANPGSKQRGLHYNSLRRLITVVMASPSTHSPTTSSYSHSLSLSRVITEAAWTLGGRINCCRGLIIEL